MKTINRNNYEEFFLLYIDNELDAADRLSVENFVEQNPDLAIEFQMLQQSKALPENISFADKETLLRTEGNNICETNYEEFFLLYIDNELSAAKRTEVEKYVLQHPELQDSFTTIKSAVLTPENISYGNKENLYRTEKRRTVYLKPWYWVAAAIAIGIFATGAWLLQNHSTTKTVIANQQPVQQQQDNNLIATTPVDNSHQTIAKEIPVITHKEKNKDDKKQQLIFIKNEEKKNEEIADVKKKNEAAQKTIAINNIKQEPIKVQQQTSKDEVAVITKEPPSPLDKIADGHLVNQQHDDVASLQSSLKNTQTENDNSYAVYPAAYKVINTDDEDRSLRIGIFDLNKTKVKNLFKRAGRMFGNKKNNTDRDGKLQVAGFEIETNQ